MERHSKKPIRLLLLPGFCGGLTTFSALAVESVKDSGGFLYLIISLVPSLAVAALCIPIARRTMAVKS